MMWISKKLREWKSSFNCKEKKCDAWQKREREIVHVRWYHEIEGEREREREREGERERESARFGDCHHARTSGQFILKLIFWSNMFWKISSKRINVKMIQSYASSNILESLWKMSTFTWDFLLKIHPCALTQLREEKVRGRFRDFYLSLFVDST